MNILSMNCQSLHVKFDYVRLLIEKKKMNALHEYCVQNDLTVNTSKSQLMQVSRRKITNLPELDYNGSSLTWVVIVINTLV